MKNTDEIVFGLENFDKHVRRHIGGDEGAHKENGIGKTNVEERRLLLLLLLLEGFNIFRCWQ